MPQTKFIFDLDGTLYRYKGGPTFATSEFYADIKRNIFAFLERELAVPSEQVPETYDHMKREYNGHVSLAVEKEFGVDRMRYFAATWRVPPEKYIEPNDDARTVLSALAGRCAVLTEAPRVWAEAALRFLNAYEFVEDVLFTGELDVRKPSVEAFRQVGGALGVPFESIYSVGDQEESDIVLARAVGMKTIRVGDGETSADFSVNNVRAVLNLSL
ncbi:HAD family hydrolase [Candidatus Uhrbacteria bacterium]|nr:HAD family hydrolase [Candidatus Uhrbacteria bacterium]